MTALASNEPLAGELPPPPSEPSLPESRVPPDRAPATEATPAVAAHSGEDGMVLAGSPERAPFAVGDLVWGKSKSHAWWPALVSDTSCAPHAAQKPRRRDVALVSCYGSGAVVWCEPAQLKPFVEEFRRMARQSGSKSFVGAVEGALDEIRRRLQWELTCGCVPPKAAGKNGGGPAGRLPVANFQPSEFVEHLHVVACDVTVANMLEVQALKSWVMAFGNGWTDGSPGHHPRRGTMELVDKIDLDVPPGELGDGNEEGDGECWITGSRGGNSPKTSEADNWHKSQKKRKVAALIVGEDLDTVELSDGDELKVEENLKAVKHLTEFENEKVMVVDNGGVEAQEDTCSGRRERKKSKYLSPPYTCLGAYSKTLNSPRRAEVKSPRMAADISALLRCNSQDFEEEDACSSGLRIGSTSMTDILSELLCTARNPLHLKWNRLANTIKSFFIKYRSSMYSSGSDFLTYQKHRNESCDISKESPYKETVNSSSEVGRSEGKQMNRKDAANTEVETGLSPVSRSHSKQGKVGGKRKMGKDKSNSVTPASLDAQVVNVPVESKYVHENIKSKDGAAREHVVPRPESVSCLQPAEVRDEKNKDKKVANGQKAPEPGHNLSVCSQEGKSGRKRKKGKPANIDISLDNLGRGIANGLEKNKSSHRRKDDENYYSNPGALLLAFAPGVALPSQSELISTFCKYGVVVESETELLNETNCARIVFAKCTDAEKALNSSDKTGVFGPAYVSYRLHYLPPIACSPHPLPPLPYIRESLERMISTLTTTSSVKETGAADGIKADARENLVGDMEGLLKKVNTMLNGAAAGT